MSSSDSEESVVYEVEQILSHRQRSGKTQYFLKWKGYSASENTWEDEAHLNCQELLEKYWKDLGGRPLRDQPSKESKTPAKESKTPLKETREKRRRGTDVKEPAPSTRASRSLSMSPVRSPRKTPRTAAPAPVEESEPFPVAKSPEKNGGGSAEKVNSGYIPTGSTWEKEIDSIDTVERRGTDLYIFVTWTNGKKSMVHREVAYKRFPQIKFISCVCLLAVISFVCQCENHIK